MASEITPVSVKEQDFLDQDDPIRGQNFVCMSFISPEEVLKNKDAYFAYEFYKNIGLQVQDLLNNLEATYPNDKSKINVIRENHEFLFSDAGMQEEFNVFNDLHGSRLEKEFFEKNNYQTSIRGFKVRGVYDTFSEAKNRAELLKKTGDKFNIYIAQVGCWCPWSPNPSDLENQEYSETQLNTIMKGYYDNMKARTAVYDKRKEDRMKEAAEELEAQKKALEAETPSIMVTDARSSADVPVEEITNLVLTNEDPWLDNKTTSSA